MNNFLKLDLPDRCKDNGSAWMHDWMDGDSEEEEEEWEGTGLKTEGQLEVDDDPQSPYFGLSK